MASFVRLDGAPPASQPLPSTGIWGKLSLFIPLIGLVFEANKMKMIKQEIRNTGNLNTRISLLQEANKIEVCCLVRDFVETAVFFTLGGYGVEIPDPFDPTTNFIDPVGFYALGIFAAIRLVLHPIDMISRNRLITQYRSRIPV